TRLQRALSATPVGPPNGFMLGGAMRHNRRMGSAAMLLLVVGAVACLDTAAPLLDTPHSVAHVLVEPAQASVSVGDQFKFSATVLDQSGDPITGQQVAWTSTDTSVAVVSNTGQETTATDVSVLVHA